MKTIYSKEPAVVGLFDIDCKEMMFVQDMPVAMPGTGVRLPPHLQCFEALVDAAISDAGLPNVFDYVYLSAKRMFVSPTSNYNRPGWHIDGYGSDDLNYLWSDSCPTEFCEQSFSLSDDLELSLRQMEEQARPENVMTFPDRMLLRIDNTIVHRTSEVLVPGIRTFAKVSVSKRKFNREGNAHNYLFDYAWNMEPRTLDRNNPNSEATHGAAQT